MKKIHSFLSFLPAVWFCLFFLGITIAAIKYGHFPKYGVDPDPTASNLSILEFTSFLVALIAYLGFYCWILVSIVLLINFKSNKAVITRNSIIYGCSLFLFFLIKYGFQSQFAWFVD